MTTTAVKRDHYQEVTNKIVAALESGTAPWHQSWSKGANAWPTNLDTGKRYRGVNVLLLLVDAMEKGFTSPYWMTFKQAKERGGHIRKGEHGSQIVFFRKIFVDDKDNPGEKRSIPMLRSFTVFNLEQTEGVKLPKHYVDPSAPVQNGDTTPQEAAEAVFEGYVGQLADYREQGDRAFYVPATDVLTVPPRESFEGMDEFYSTRHHEMVHSTGHPSRLNRKFGEQFGNHDYGREELVAEMGAAFLCAETGIESTVDNSAAYLGSWIRTIKEDPRAVVVAAGAAQRAVDHILGRTFEEAQGD